MHFDEKQRRFFRVLFSIVFGLSAANFTVHANGSYLFKVREWSIYQFLPASLETERMLAIEGLKALVDGFAEFMLLIYASFLVSTVLIALLTMRRLAKTLGILKFSTLERPVLFWGSWFLYFAVSYLWVYPGHRLLVNGAKLATSYTSLTFWMSFMFSMLIGILALCLFAPDFTWRAAGLESEGEKNDTNRLR